MEKKTLICIHAQINYSTSSCEIDLIIITISLKSLKSTLKATLKSLFVYSTMCGSM